MVRNLPHVLRFVWALAKTQIPRFVPPPAIRIENASVERDSSKLANMTLDVLCYKTALGRNCVKKIVRLEVIVLTEGVNVVEDVPRTNIAQMGYANVYQDITEKREFACHCPRVHHHVRLVKYVKMADAFAEEETFTMEDASLVLQNIQSVLSSGKIFKACPSNCPLTCTVFVLMGFLEHNGGCVKSDQCPNKCGYGEKPTACASFCVGTCKNPNPEICAPTCDPNRKCECRKGFVQVSQHDTRCTLLQNCPRPQLCKKNCPPGSDCIGGKCQCRRRCPPNEHCPDGICECLPGHYRKNGVCVSLSTCSSSCAPGQVCEDGRCVCRRGDFYNGRCVTCPPGKIFKACPSNCPLTCEKPFPQVCTEECNLDRYCVCPNGFLEHNGGCVKRYQCPNKQCRPRCKPGWKYVSGKCVCVGIYCP
uniref:SCO-spondin-like n=1 Tax=Styela clava TaxID=7725 RepID=UPI00193A6DC5|nr:SCO-spondin-like [Styela clava]